MKIIEKIIQCKSCDGTGIYVGMAERDGAAVICKTCKGTGKYKYKFEYEEFTGLKKRNNVSRIFKESYGYVIAPKILNFENIGQIDMTKEGVTYTDFLNGIMPEHTKNLACPMIAEQGICQEIEGFIDECEKLDGSNLWGKRLSNCRNQINKLYCWKRFEENKKSY